MYNRDFLLYLIVITITITVVSTIPSAQNSRSILERSSQTALQIDPQVIQRTVRSSNNQHQFDPTSFQSDGESEPSAPEEILDIYFDFIRNNDENNCLMRIVCQIGYNKTAFGNFGEQIAGFFTEIDSNTGSAAQYRAAFQTYLTEPNVDKCVEKYPECQYATNDMVEVGNDLMTKNLTGIQLDDVNKGPTWIYPAN